MRSSELILNADGSVYHLALRPGELAEKIIFVGDPDRVKRVSAHFDRVELRRQKREFCTETGWYEGVRMSVISTGIGADNIDIVWNEIDALCNLDLPTGQVKTSLTPLRVLRLGTCGGLQPEPDMGSMVHSRFGIGGDALMHYYGLRPHQAFQQALDKFADNIMGKALPFYSGESASTLTSLLGEQFPDIHHGITFTAAGFYGPQGRSLGRLALRFPHLPDHMAQFQFEGLSVLNMEMETAAILALGSALGHECGSLSVILANRAKGSFISDPKAAEKQLIERGLQVMKAW